MKCMEREKPQKVERGMFLVATPQLTDPNFRQTVVLICEHGSGGSLGLVVNRRTDQHITEVLPKATGLHEKAGFVYTGGPVQKDSLLILHRLGRDKEARHRSDEALRLGSRDPLLRYHSGAIAAALGDAKGARRDLMLALSTDPGFSATGAAEARRILASLPL